MLARSHPWFFALAATLLACERKPAEPTGVVLGPVDAGSDTAAPTTAPSASPSAAPSASPLDLHPGQGGPCTRDDECTVTNASSGCCACCGAPPRSVTKAELQREVDACASKDLKCAKCDALCKPTESAESYRPVCVGGVCRATRR